MTCLLLALLLLQRWKRQSDSIISQTTLPRFLLFVGFSSVGEMISKFFSVELKIYESKNNKQRCQTLHPSSDASLGRVRVELVPALAEECGRAFIHVCCSLQWQGLKINHFKQFTIMNWKQVVHNYGTTIGSKNCACSSLDAE